MQRRGFIVGGACGLGVGAAGAANGAGSGGANMLGADAAVVVVPDGRALLLRRFAPAASALERHAARPGAWYALLYLPMAPAWPMQLRLWPARRDHEIHLLALDAAPGDAPTVVHPLPTELERSRDGRAGRWASRFMLPASSTAAAIYVLIEQWRIEIDEPPPLWIDWQAERTAQRPGEPWWAAQVQPHAAGRAPPSPLTQQHRATAHEVPIFEPPAASERGVWR